MYFNEDTIENLVKRAVENMFEKEPNIFGFTIHSGSTEWNLCHHLAIHLALLFPDYNCDVEIIHRENEKTITRPDIIVHKRGMDENILVVESKYNDRHDMNDDFSKIVSHYFIDPYQYKFGAVVNFNIEGFKHTSVEVFENS